MTQGTATGIGKDAPGPSRLHPRNDRGVRQSQPRESRSDSGPILIVGLPRSGTTWIGKIFDSHPQTVYLHEPDSAVPLDEVPLIANSIEAATDVPQLQAAVARTLRVRATRVAGSLPRFHKAYRSALTDWLHRQLAIAAKIRSRLIGECSIPDLILGSPHPPPRLVWKSIESVGRVGLFAQLLPELRVIHILRHPCGWIASQTRGHTEGRFATARDDWWRFDLLESTAPAQRRGLTAASFNEMSALERDAWSWVLWNENGAEPGESLGNVMTIRYEDICSEPIEQSKRMFDFAGLDWHAQTESFIGRSMSTHQDSYYSVFRDPLIAANRWRKDFPPAKVSVVESIMRQSHLARPFLGASG